MLDVTTDEPWNSSRQFALLHSALCSLLLVFTRKPLLVNRRSNKDQPNFFSSSLHAHFHSISFLFYIHHPLPLHLHPQIPENDQSVKLTLRLAPDESIAQNDPNPSKFPLISIRSRLAATHAHRAPTADPPKVPSTVRPGTQSVPLLRAQCFQMVRDKSLSLLQSNLARSKLFVGRLRFDLLRLDLFFLLNAFHHVVCHPRKSQSQSLAHRLIIQSRKTRPLFLERTADDAVF